MNNDDYDENEDSDFADEQLEQLLRANERLQQELASTQQQLASHSALSASLAQQQAGETLVRFGDGLSTKWLNARSIRMLSLSESTVLDTEKFTTEGSGKYAVLVDELQVTQHLPPEEAERWLDEVAEALNRILQPPQS